MVGVVGELISSWLTPISLFILFNFVIAIILISEVVNNHHRSDHHHLHLDADDQPSLVPPPQLVRAPSLFSRVTFSNLRSHSYNPNTEPVQSEPAESGSEPVQPGPKPVTRAPSLLSRVTSFNLRTHSNNRNPELDLRAPVESCSEPVQPGTEPAPSLLSRATSFRISSLRNPGRPGEANVNQRNGKPPAAERKEKTALMRREQVDAEVDAKADDFINKFKQQLKMQRLESLLRYRNTPAPTT